MGQILISQETHFISIYISLLYIMLNTNNQNLSYVVSQKKTTTHNHHSRVVRASAYGAVDQWFESQSRTEGRSVGEPPAGKMIVTVGPYS